MKTSLLLTLTLFIFPLAIHAEKAPASYTEAVGIKDPTKLIDNQISILDKLIETTKMSVKNQENLRTQIQEYQKIQDLYLKNTQDNDQLLRMIKSAARLLNTIKTNQLSYLFDAEFISELTMFAQIANKRGIPKP
jgi:hypothetical protein